MDIIEIIIIGIGLAMDAFAVSVCKGLAMKNMEWEKAFIIALYFGVFQAGMPIIGYFLGKTFVIFIESIDHWIAFILLVLIGLKMIKESTDNEILNSNSHVDFKTMIVLAIATSIDALAVGVTFSFFRLNLVLAIVIIGVVTFLLSIIGTKVGNKFGDKLENKAEIVGGIVLITIGFRILLKHLQIIN